MIYTKRLAFHVAALALGRTSLVVRKAEDGLNGPDKNGAESELP